MHIKTLKNIPKQIPELPVQGYISQKKTNKKTNKLWTS